MKLCIKSVADAQLKNDVLFLVLNLGRVIMRIMNK